MKASPVWETFQVLLLRAQARSASNSLMLSSFSFFFRKKLFIVDRRAGCFRALEWRSRQIVEHDVLTLCATIARTATFASSQIGRPPARLQIRKRIRLKP